MKSIIACIVLVSLFVATEALCIDRSLIERRIERLERKIEQEVKKHDTMVKLYNSHIVRVNYLREAAYEDIKTDDSYRFVERYKRNKYIEKSYERIEKMKMKLEQLKRKLMR